MTYFSNGTMGELFQEQNCFAGCVHWKDEDDGRGPGCPVWDAYLLFNRVEKDDARTILDVLIPDAGFSDDHAWIIPTCSMFHCASPDKYLEARGQLNAFAP